MDIHLKPLLHNNQPVIGIYFKYNKELSLLIRQLHGVKWSQTNKCWYLPMSESNYVEIKKIVKEKGHLETSEIDQYLLKNKQVQKTLVNGLQSPKQNSLHQSVAWILSNENLQALEKFVEQLKLKSYSPSTLKKYRNEFIQLLKLLKSKPVYELTVEDIRRYMLYILEKEGVRENTAHSRINALKFYFEQVLGRNKFFVAVPRPKKPQILPKLLNENEIARLFNAVDNKKHKAMLFTAYSAGLRVSEICNLKITDIDSSRMQILIQLAKGKKDRYVNLGPLLLDILREYIKMYKPRPKKYLFESEQTHTAYPSRTIQQIFSNAKNKAGIKKEVGIHSLRHSFATHLLEKGTDIIYIKDLLGHFNIKTTERYLHVSRKKLVNITSPFDDLWKKENIKW